MTVAISGNNESGLLCKLCPLIVLRTSKPKVARRIRKETFRGDCRWLSLAIMRSSVRGPSTRERIY
jgi:hypothetical protein